MANTNLNDTKSANLRAPLTDELIPPDLRSSFNADLHEYQKETVNFLITRYTEYIFQLDNPEVKDRNPNSRKLSGFIVAHEMGLGKTVMILFFLKCIVKCLQSRRQPTRIIIVVYKTIIQQWRKELRKWCKAIPVFIYHGDNKVRKSQLYAASKERVCIILTTYALISSDAEQIIHILQSSLHQQQDIPFNFGAKSTSDSPTDDILSGLNAHEFSTITESSQKKGSNEMDSSDNLEVDDFHSANTGTDPSSNFDWLKKQLSRDTISSSPLQLFQNQQGLDSMEPPIKSSKSSFYKQSSLSNQFTSATIRKNLLHDRLPLDNAIPTHCIDILVLDEATAIKNPQTKTIRGLRALDVGFKVALTGTPILNSPIELWSIVDFLSKGYLGNRSRFQKKIAEPIATGELKDADDEQRFTAQKARKALQKKLAPMIIRHTTADLNRLPVNKIAFTFWLPLTRVQFILYKAAVDTISCYNSMELGRNNLNDKICLKFVHFLRKVCEHPCQLADDDTALYTNEMKSCILELKRKAAQPQAQIDETDYINIVSKLDIHKAAFQDETTLLNDTNNDLNRMTLDVYDRMPLESEQTQDDMQNTTSHAERLDSTIHQSPDHYDLAVTSITTLSSRFHLLLEIMRHIKANNYRVIIFCDYRIIFSLIETLLSQNNILSLRLDGSISDPIERNRRCEEFNNDEKYTAFLVSIKLGAMGLNITGANRVIIFSPAWNLKVEEQAIARAYRIGQKRNVVIYKIVCTNTIEEKIVIRQLQKAGMANVTLDDQKYQSVIGKNDVNSLFHFDRANRLKAHLPESIQQHATSRHVKNTIKKTLGDSLDNSQSEAAKELAFIEKLTNQKLCTDVSVLDYLYSNENIDKETDLADAEHNHRLPMDFDQMMLSGPHTPIKQSRCHSNPQWKSIVFAYMLSHCETLFLTAFEPIFADFTDSTSYINRLIKDYRTRMRNELIKQNLGLNHEYFLPSMSTIPSVIYFIPQSDQILHEKWHCYVAKAALLMTIEDWNSQKVLDEVRLYTGPLRVLNSQVLTSTSDPLYVSLVYQFRSIISSFISFINEILIPTEADFYNFLQMDTKQFETFLHNLASDRLIMFKSDPEAFRIATVYPSTLNLLSEKCSQTHFTFTDLVLEYDIEENWEELRRMQLCWLPALNPIRKKVPLLWGAIADAISNAQKAVLTEMITDCHGEVRSTLLSRCIGTPVAHTVDPDSEYIQPSNSMELQKSLDKISNHFNRVMKLMQCQDISSRLDEQWRKLSPDILELIFKDTYQKLKKYNINLFKEDKLASLTLSTNYLTTGSADGLSNNHTFHFNYEATPPTYFPNTARIQNVAIPNFNINGSTINDSQTNTNNNDADHNDDTNAANYIDDDFIDILA